MFAPWPASLRLHFVRTRIGPWVGLGVAGALGVCRPDSAWAVETGPGSDPSTLTAATALPPPAPAPLPAPDPLPASDASPPAVAPTPSPPAAGRRLILLPTRVSTTSNPGTPDGLGPLEKEARALDVFLRETAEDLGFEVSLGPSRPRDEGDPELLPLPPESGLNLLEPTLDGVAEGGLRLRLSLAAPCWSQAKAEETRTTPAELQLRAAVLLRTLWKTLEAEQTTPTLGAPPEGVPSPAPRSPGRFALGLHATAYGALVGYSLQRGSGSDDPRLLYPLLATGAGLGLGIAAVAADEWDVGRADASYLASGAWWPTLATHWLLAAKASPDQVSAEDRWSWGLVGGAAGLSLTTLGLTPRPMSDGGALFAHSAPVWGLVGGGLVEMARDGKLRQVPREGMGWGAGGGWLLAASLASQTRIEEAPILVLNMGLGIGAGTTALLASPLLLGDPGPGRQRAYAISVGAGGVLGTGAMFWLVLQALEHMSRPETSGGTSWARVEGVEPGWVGSTGALGLNVRGILR